MGLSDGRDRDRTDDLYRVKVALIPTELRAPKRRLYNARLERAVFLLCPYESSHALKLVVGSRSGLPHDTEFRAQLGTGKNLFA